MSRAVSCCARRKLSLLKETRMAICGSFYLFARQNVDASPEEPGLYGLFRHGELIYIGSSGVSIRSRLQRHFNGYEGRCTQMATHYQREISSTPPPASLNVGTVK